ncbi:ABC-2 type transport system ATP-binding protein [Clostridium punense]|uniref:ABC-2 type transport system ATP-binding protein n=1 Tax=Clostridium punense TaxID=1054297 RepID=A0ABS4K1H1_9CLOT|nr:MULTISPECIES: ATP-binding cassette domain-containing protein [Clostridium]EQB87407.1 hypothetical protein M918_09170 [Clostridium sp. BL8]MBP2021626.1 ABC-2 type transport system ATP-binding protein [Clostridium punense]
MSKYIIEVKNVSKKFQDHTVLNDVSVNFQSGKIYGIIGRNGSGKTVLFKSICGFFPVTSGEIVVNNKIVGKEIDIPSDLGIIIEEPGFLPNYSGYKNLKFLSNIHRKIDDKGIYSVLKRVGLEKDAHKKVGKYSMGMRQRLGIAQSIMENQSILILDEPMNGLDKSGVEDVRTLLKELREEGKTIIIASHNSEDIRILCDEVYEMDGGILSKYIV